MNDKIPAMIVEHDDYDTNKNMKDMTVDEIYCHILSKEMTLKEFESWYSDKCDEYFLMGQDSVYELI